MVVLMTKHYGTPLLLHHRVKYESIPLHLIPHYYLLNADLYSLPTGYNCAISPFGGLTERQYRILTAASPTWDLRCLVPGKTYYLRFDGNDGVLGIPPDEERGILILPTDNTTVYPSVVNDEPCGAIDVTQFVRTSPCTSDNQYYTNAYSIFVCITKCR